MIHLLCNIWVNLEKNSAFKQSFCHSPLLLPLPEPSFSNIRRVAARILLFQKQLQFWKTQKVIRCSNSKGIPPIISSNSVQNQNQQWFSVNCIRSYCRIISGDKLTIYQPLPDIAQQNVNFNFLIGFDQLIQEITRHYTTHTIVRVFNTMQQLRQHLKLNLHRSVLPLSLSHCKPTILQTGRILASTLLEIRSSQLKLFSQQKVE